MRFVHRIIQMKLCENRPQPRANPNAVVMRAVGRIAETILGTGFDKVAGAARKAEAFSAKAPWDIAHTTSINQF